MIRSDECQWVDSPCDAERVAGKSAIDADFSPQGGA